MYVLVTTAERGVFMGELEGEPTAERVVLRNARCCVYWDRMVKGVFGLAAVGPNDSCRIGPATPRKIITGKITSVDECTPEAVAAWEREPWA